jgi:hypothetical protein
LTERSEELSMISDREIADRGLMLRVNFATPGR